MLIFSIRMKSPRPTLVCMAMFVLSVTWCCVQPVFCVILKLFLSWVDWDCTGVTERPDQEQSRC